MKNLKLLFKKIKFSPLPHLSANVKNLKTKHLRIDTPSILWDVKNLPNGNYLIRGNKRHEAESYLFIDGVWYNTAVNDAKKRRWADPYRIIDYGYLPNRRDSEWDALIVSYKSLSSKEKCTIQAFLHQKEMKELKNRIRIQKRKMIRQ